MPTVPIPQPGAIITCDNCGNTRAWGGVYSLEDNLAYCLVCLNQWKVLGGVGQPTDAIIAYAYNNGPLLNDAIEATV